MRRGDPPIIVEQSLDASIDTVWRAVTEVDQMRQWYFRNIPVLEAEVGFETRFEVTSQGRVFPRRWKVTKVVSLKTLEWNWKYDGYPGDSFVAFELFEQNNLTKLRLTARIVKNFPEEFLSSQERTVLKAGHISALRV